MLKQTKFTGALMTAALAVFLAVPSAALAQDSGSGKRKVKTRVEPEYPALARQMNVVGKVKIEVTISAEGHVTGTRVVGGSPLLVSSAVEAVKKWKFEPAAKESSEVVEFEFRDPTS